MYAMNLVSLTNGFCDRLRIAAEMLLIGVAYQENGTTWRVISIEGDDIGTMSTFVISQTVNMLKKKGLKPNRRREWYAIGDQPVITFAHDERLSTVPVAERQAMIDRRFRNPVTLM